ncbi:MAG TPA: GNAT family N-acetyltransferase [Aestuariivirgaceae bacterium]|nr:GNAT family N-acetyltransferase [Aestuariivirgaceae bacterium]
MTRTKPGACNVGRMIGCDDIDQFGWPAVFDVLERDGVIGLRMVAADQLPEITERLASKGFRLDLWDVFTASAAEALPMTRQILAPGLPSGLTRLALGNEPEGALIRRVQEFLLQNDIVPFSGAMLIGAVVPAITVVLTDEGGDIVACANSYLPHNAFSPFRNAAWGGLVAVAESQRGRKLGRYVNALMVEEAFAALNAEMIYEIVSDANLASRRMVEASGLRFAANLKSGSAVGIGVVGRFTR